MLILVVNAGSSSLKYQLIDMKTEKALAKGIAERIAAPRSCLTHDKIGMEKLKNEVDMPNHSVAMRIVFDALTNSETGVIRDLSDISAIGHRVVHGGEAFSGSVRIDEKVIDIIDKLSDLAPLHNPPNLMGIKAAIEVAPDAPQIAVFDTAYHQTIPPHAYLYALSYEMYKEHCIRRYGFHGTSHQYVAAKAHKILEERGIPLENQKIVTCHLGNGASLTANKGGKSVDTSMGLTPAEGLVMGTRSGDIDPAIILYLQKRLNYSVDDIDELINKKSGLLGFSGVSNDMRDILDLSAKGHERAQTILNIFCYRVRKYIGAYAAAMGGLDALVFTAGIGEHCPPVRTQICEGLEFLGIKVNYEVNADCHVECDISADDATVRVLIIPTDEELTIARETVRLINGGE